MSSLQEVMSTHAEIDIVLNAKLMLRNYGFMKEASLYYQLIIFIWYLQFQNN